MNESVETGVSDFSESGIESIHDSLNCAGRILTSINRSANLYVSKTNLCQKGLISSPSDGLQMYISINISWLEKAWEGTIEKE